MSNNTVQQLVHDRLSDLGAIAPVSSHPVSLRLSLDVVNQLDVLAKYLGYGNRSQLLRDLITSSLDDLVIETRKALSEDTAVTDMFQAELLQALNI